MERMTPVEMMVFIHKTFFDPIFVYTKSHEIDKFVSGLYQILIACSF